MFQRHCPQSAPKASPFTLCRHRTKNVRPRREPRSHLVQVLNVTSQHNSLGKQRLLHGSISTWPSGTVLTLNTIIIISVIKLFKILVGTSVGFQKCVHLGQSKMVITKVKGSEPAHSTYEYVHREIHTYVKSKGSTFSHGIR